ncbi:MAG TPA: hypothetical protein VKG22_09835 [Stellaceae bacterium]|nr:hypothetical protein [Stellaceae bacterium]HMD66930.1 hypothetical protein [Stellaceae bacterium]
MVEIRRIGAQIGAEIRGMDLTLDDGGDWRKECRRSCSEMASA